MKEKTLKIIAIVLAITTVAAVAAFVFTSIESDKAPSESGNTTTAAQTQTDNVYSYEESAYTQDASSIGINGEIFMPTDIENVYFSAGLSGQVDFFDYADGNFGIEELPVKQVKTSISATYDTIPVTINYIEKDGKTFGIGVFTSEMSDSVKVYPYAFVKLINKPSGYGTGHLLLVDFEKENFYNADKIYSEIYDFDIASGKASSIVSNNTRLIDKNGAFRNDWTMLTDDFIANLGGAKYFLSSRYYNTDDRGTRADVMILSNAYKPEIVAKDILGIWFVNDANGMHYLRKTDKGFNLIVNKDKKETVSKEFEGDYFADYLQDGNLLINKKSLVMTDLVTGETKTLKDININGFDRVYVSPDGAKLVFAKNGVANENGAIVQQLIYCTADGSKEPAVYNEPLLFDESSGFVWLAADEIMSVRAYDGTGTQVGSMYYSY